VTNLITVDNVLKDKQNPFGDMHLEEAILSDQFTNDFINGIVKLHKLVALIMFIGKDLLLDIHLHVEQQLEKQLADPKVLADHLSFLNGEDVFELGLFV
jgi:hypothetical protein